MAPLASTSEDLSSDLETSTGTVQLCDGLMQVHLRYILFSSAVIFVVQTSATQQKKKNHFAAAD